MNLPIALSGERLVAVVCIAAVLLAGLGIVVGFTRRTAAVAVVLAFAVNAFYPGGATGLIVDALAPLRGLTDDAAERRDGRNVQIDGAVGDPAPVPDR